MALLLGLFSNAFGAREEIKEITAVIAPIDEGFKLYATRNGQLEPLRLAVDPSIRPEEFFNPEDPTAYRYRYVVRGPKGEKIADLPARPQTLHTFDDPWLELKALQLAGVPLSKCTVSFETFSDDKVWSTGLVILSGGDKPQEVRAKIPTYTISDRVIGPNFVNDAPSSGGRNRFIAKLFAEDGEAVKATTRIDLDEDGDGVMSVRFETTGSEKYSLKNLTEKELEDTPASIYRLALTSKEGKVLAVRELTVGNSGLYSHHLRHLLFCEVPALKSFGVSNMMIIVQTWDGTMHEWRDGLYFVKLAPDGSTTDELILATCSPAPLSVK